MSALNEEKTVDIRFFGDKKPPVKVPFEKAITWEEAIQEDFAEERCGACSYESCRRVCVLV